MIHQMKAEISITITCTKFKFCFVILHTHSEGTMSKIFLLGLSFHFMLKIGKFFFKMSEHHFLINIKNELGPK